MDLISELREGRKKPSVAYHDFLNLYGRNKNSVFCFVEGEDSKYYEIRLRARHNDKQFEFIKAGGKEAVLKIFNLIQNNEYSNAKTLYFVDSDFDEKLNNINIYETPCYSIENFYTSVNVIEKILKSEFDLTELDDRYHEYKDMYIKRQEEFHNAVELLNAWIIYFKGMKGQKLNLNNIKIKKLIYITLGKVEQLYDYNHLEKLFPDQPKASDKDLNKIIEILRKSDRQKKFRGKFELEFFIVFLEQLLEYVNNNKLLDKKVSLQLGKKNIILQFSSYADVCDKLIAYLDCHLSNSLGYKEAAATLHYE